MRGGWEDGYGMDQYGNGEIVKEMDEESGRDTERGAA